jgi:hypothetical protein
MMALLRSFETSVLTRAPRRNIPEDGILHSHRRENLKSYSATLCSLCKKSDIFRESLRKPSLLYIRRNVTWQKVISAVDRAVAQAVSRRLPIAAARLRAQVKICGICGGQSGTGAAFLRLLRLHCHTIIPLIAPKSSSCVMQGWYN